MKKLQKKKKKSEKVALNEFLGDNREQASKRRHFSFSGVLIKLIELTFNEVKKSDFHVCTEK